MLRQTKFKMDMDASLQLDDLERLQLRINTRAATLFQPLSSRNSFLYICQLLSSHLRQGEGESRLVWNKKVCGGSQLQDLRETGDACQLVFVRQDRSWTRLNIELAHFQELVKLYDIFPPFWECVFTFGRKTRENELNFPRFKTRSHLMLGTGPHILEESAYVIRRVELNHRGNSDPWSIRQTGVYHGIKSSTMSPKMRQVVPQSRFLIIAPSINAESKIARHLEQAALSKSSISPWNIHRIIISDSLAGWQDYMASIETRLWQQTVDLICYGPNGDDKPPPDWDLKYGRRQELKVIENFVMDLMIIMPAMLDTIDGLRVQCRTFLKTNEVALTKAERSCHEMILLEFDEYVKDARLNVDRAKELKSRTESTINLVCNASFNAEVEVDLSLFLSQHSNDSMHKLTTQEKSTKDAAAVKILTVITLIYLPTTIVANFFSTQFVQTNDSGHMTLLANSWILAAVSVPLTAVTIMLWWLWVYLAERRIKGTLNWRHKLRSILVKPFIPPTKNDSNDVSSARNMAQDIERGLVPPTEKHPEAASIGSSVTAARND
ncbi:cmgc cdk kinase protein [Rutstroemia sp. NJR-2017a BVV2]|nr:cmgc cdk kinase protein [Rutstroemia sp. NJR-2017a BVV2]